jgi:hypothetical protein
VSGRPREAQKIRRVVGTRGSQWAGFESKTLRVGLSLDEGFDFYAGGDLRRNILLSARTIGLRRSKLLSGMLGGPAIMYIVGHCWRAGRGR